MCIRHTGLLCLKLQNCRRLVCNVTAFILPCAGFKNNNFLLVRHFATTKPCFGSNFKHVPYNIVWRLHFTWREKVIYHTKVFHMSFPCKDYALRTDESFNDRLDEIHHHEGPHASEGTGVGMVSQFPLDYMHLVCLGIVGRLLKMWLRGIHEALYSGGVCQKAAISFVHWTCNAGQFSGQRPVSEFYASLLWHLHLSKPYIFLPHWLCWHFTEVVCAALCYTLWETQHCV